MTLIIFYSIYRAINRVFPSLRALKVMFMIELFSSWKHCWNSSPSDCSGEGNENWLWSDDAEILQVFLPVLKWEKSQSSHVLALLIRLAKSTPTLRCCAFNWISMQAKGWKHAGILQINSQHFTQRCTPSTFHPFRPAEYSLKVSLNSLKQQQHQQMIVRAGLPFPNWILMVGLLMWLWHTIQALRHARGSQFPIVMESRVHLADQ